MFWKRTEQPGGNQEAEQVREYVRERLLAALDFATLGAYDLLQGEDGSLRQAPRARAQVPASAAGEAPGAPLASAPQPADEPAATFEEPHHSDRQASAAPTSRDSEAQATAARTPHHSEQSATGHPSHHRSERPRRHTSIRAGTRCDAARRPRCGIHQDRTSTHGSLLSSAERSVTGRHAVRRARRPGRPPVPEQPCSWATWLAEPRF
jgi:hypothetical protein